MLDKCLFVGLLSLVLFFMSVLWFKRTNFQTITQTVSLACVGTFLTISSLCFFVVLIKLMLWTLEV